MVTVLMKDFPVSRRQPGFPGSLQNHSPAISSSVELTLKGHFKNPD